VTLTRYVPGVREVTDSIEVPEAITLVGFKVAVSPEGDATDSVTTPVNELTAPILIDPVPELPAVIVIVAGVAVIVKSGAPVTTTETMIEWPREPLAAVTLMKKDPAADPETVRVDVPEPMRNEVLRLAVRLAAEGMAAILTFPLKPDRLVTVIVDVPDPPATKVRLDGLAEIVKSGTAS
jgi:hypothetical protein